MPYGLQAPNWVDNSWATAGGTGSDIATQTADSSAGTDGWGDFFKGLTQTAFSYALQKDASKNQVTAQPAMQPVYVQAPASASASLNIPPGLLLLGVGVVAYLALSK
jgi:hypothetical protein